MNIEYTVTYTVIVSDEIAEKAKKIAEDKGPSACIKYLRDMYPMYDLATCNSIRKVLTQGTNEFELHIPL